MSESLMISSSKLTSDSWRINLVALIIKFGELIEKF